MQICSFLFNFLSPLRSFPNNSPYKVSGAVHFNSRGTRLLCLEAGEPTLAVYDCKSQEATAPVRRLAAAPYGLLTTYSCLVPEISEMTCCFAGQDSEFVIGSSSVSGRIHIWSISGEDQYQSGEQQPLLTLYHNDCNKVRYNASASTLASFGSQFRVWTPFRLPDFISNNSEDDEEEDSSEMSSSSGEEDEDVYSSTEDSSFSDEDV